MWNVLRARGLHGLKFRREHQIDRYIVDFCCLEAKLVVECDGAPHFERGGITLDDARTAELQRMGFTVVRFENIDVVQNPTIVRAQLERVVEALQKHTAAHVATPHP